MKNSFTLFLFAFIIINSNQVHLSKQEDFQGNTTLVVKHRTKRNLIFQPGTRIMFRVNTKDNIIKVNQIFAHGFGFRGNIDLTQPDKPSLLPRVRRAVSRREVFETLEELVNQHGFNGKACISRLICDAKVNKPKRTDGIYTKLLRLIFNTQESENENFNQLTYNDCTKRHLECPLHLLEISPFTDL